MLETRGLIIEPWLRFPGNEEWRHAAPAGAWVRAIADAASGQRLGFACWQHTGSGPFASWFGRRQIAVFETDDASLTLTLRRGFWRGWEIFDAEERPLGHVQRGAVLGTSGECLASVHNGVDPGAFRNRAGEELARFSRRDLNGWLLTFLDPPQENPFGRMALLAAVLTWDGGPPC